MAGVSQQTAGEKDWARLSQKKNSKYDNKNAICFPVLWLQQDMSRWHTTELWQGCYSETS